MPPRLAERWLARALPADQRVMILGDLEVEFELRRRRWGAAGATVWYWSQAAIFAVSIPIYVLRGDLPGRERAAHAPWLEGVSVWARELRVALQSLSRSPAFALAVLLHLVVGLAVCTAVAQVVDDELLRPLPYSEPDRLVRVGLVDPQWDEGRARGVSDGLGQMSQWQLAFFDSSAGSVQDIAGFYPGSVWLQSRRTTQRLSSLLVTASFFEVLGIPPAVGRAFVAADAWAARRPPVVVSRDLWTRELGAQSLTGETTLMLDRIEYAVVGVLPESFYFPGRPQVVRLIRADTSPRLSSAMDAAGPDFRWLNGIARLADGVSHDELQVELDRLLREPSVAGVFTDAAPMEARASPLHGWIVGSNAASLRVALGAALVLWLMLWANALSLLLDRVAGRRRELAIRAALGASRMALVPAVMAESVILIAAGTLASIPVASTGIALLVQVNEPLLQRDPSVRLNAPALGLLAALVALLIASTILVLMLATRISPRRAPGAQTITERVATARASRCLVVSQVALGMVVAVCTGLVAASFVRLAGSDLGLASPEQVMAVEVGTSEVVAPRWERVRAALLSLEADLRRRPEVAGAGLINSLPMQSAATVNGARLTPDRPLEGLVDLRVVSGGYFEAAGLARVAGAVLTDVDAAEGSRRVVVNRRLTRALADPADAIGRALSLPVAGLEDLEIVAVVEDAQDRGPRHEVPPTIYFPISPMLGRGSFVLLVRGNVSAEELERVVAEVAGTLDPVLPTETTGPLDEYLARSLTREHRAPLAIGFLASAIALLLVGSSVHVVVAGFVRAHAGELGVRRVLGASGRRLVAEILREALGLVIAGIGIGLAASIFLRRSLEELLFATRSVDLLTPVGVAAALMALAVAASIRPIRAALRLDVAGSLRHE